jgi:hypothetical protein
MQKQHIINAYSRRTLYLGLILGLLIIVTVAQAQTIVTGNLSGWQDASLGSPSITFADGPGAPPLGAGSLQVEITGPAQKFIVRPPYGYGVTGNSTPADQFVSFSYAFHVDDASTVGAINFYTNLYVVNTGYTDGSWFDCRYDLEPSNTLARDTWHTLSFDKNFTAWSLKAGSGQCPNSIAELPADAQILFISLNAGQSTDTDIGLLGAFDAVSITTTSGTTTWDFEVGGQSSGSGGEEITVFTDGRINNTDLAAPVVAYPVEMEGGTGFVFYGISGSSQGFTALVVSPADIASVSELPSVNTLISESEIGGYYITFWRLTTGEFQLNVAQPNGKMYVMIFDRLDMTGSYRSFEYEME